MQEKLELLSRGIVHSIASAGIPIVGSELSGSVITGVVMNFPARDVDLIVYVETDTEITDELEQRAASAVQGSVTSSLRVSRFGIDMPLTHIRSESGVDPLLFANWDIWLTRDNFLPLSRVWRALFLPEEIRWQQEVRRLIIEHLSTVEYQDAKARQICEARWRFCARCLIEQRGDSGNLGLLSVSDDTRLRDMMQRVDVDCVSRWATQDEDWTIRPLSQLGYETKRKLLHLGAFVPDVPEEPEWVQWGRALISRSQPLLESPNLSAWLTEGVPSPD